MYYNQENKTILDRQTIRWGDLNFVRPSAEEEPPLIGTLLTSNILKLKITNLDLLGKYFWGVYTQQALLNVSATNTGTFTLTGSDTEANIDVPLVDNTYSPNNTYYFGMRKDGGEEKIQIRFTTGQNLVKATGTDIINSLPGGSVTYNGLEVNTTNNRLLTEGSLELNNITTFDNTKIPTNLAVKTFVENTITNFDLDTNTNFSDLKTRVSDVESNKRDIADSYSQTEIDTKDSDTLTSANNYTDAEIDSLSNLVTLKDKFEIYSLKSDFPATGSFSKVYFASDTRNFYRWDGTVYRSDITDQLLFQKSVKNADYTPVTFNNVVTGADGEGASVTVPIILTGTTYPFDINAVNSIGGAIKLTRFTDSGNIKAKGELIISDNGVPPETTIEFTREKVSFKKSIDLENNAIENLQPNSLPNGTLSQMPARTIKGNDTASAATAKDLTVSEIISLLNFNNDFDNQVRANRLDQLGSPANDLDLNSQKIENLATPTAADDATNKSYVDNLDSANVKLNSNQTIADVKTFSSPVVGQDPTASNHLTTRNFVDPANLIKNQVLTVVNRYASASLNLPAWKIYALEDYYLRLIRETKQSTLPVFFIDPELSADTSNSSSTTLINLGTSGSTISITGGNIGSIVVNNEFSFSGANYLVSTTSQNGGGVGYTTAVNINRSSATTMRVIGSTTTNASYDTLHVGGAYRTRTYDTNVSNGIGRDASDFAVSTNRKYITTYDGNNLNSGLKIFTNGIQTDTGDGNIGSFSSSRNTGAGTIQVGAALAGNDTFVGVIRRVLVFHGTAFSSSQVGALNNLI